MVKNTAPILRFVYQIGIVAVQEGGYSYSSSSEDKNGSETCGGRFKSRKLRVAVLVFEWKWYSSRRCIFTLFSPIFANTSIFTDNIRIILRAI